MAVYTDVFIAHPDEVDALDDDLSIRHFAQVQGKSVTHVEIATLDQILTGEKEQFPALVREAYDGDVLIVMLRQALSDALATMRDEQIPNVAAAWAATEEWQLVNGTTGDLAGWLRDVRSLAQQARQSHKRMYVWIGV